MNSTLTISNQNTEIANQEQVFDALVKSAPSATVPYIEALRSNLIKESSDKEIKAALSAGINKAIFNMGHPSKDLTELSAMIEELLRDVKSLLGTLTTGEIVLACQNGSKEAYGQNFGVNVSSVLRWMMGLLNDLKRHEAKKALLEANTPKEEPKKETTEEEWKDLAISAFEKFKANGVYEDWGNIIYLFLERKGILNFSNERKAEIKRIVENRELAKLSAPLSMEEKRSFDKLKDQLLSGSMDLKGKCRREALLIYFKELDEMGLAMEDLLHD